MTDEAFIPVSAVRIDDDVKREVLAVLESGQLAQGPVVGQLETEFAQMCSTRHAVAVNSGTTALVATLQALDVGAGHEVVTSPFTFAATLNAILETGATARFADIDLADFAMDPNEVEAVVGARTKVVMPVDLYGQPAAVPDLLAIANGVGAQLVEDAAQAHGATVDGKPAGSFDVGCFSLYATKNLTTGEGGLITTDDDALAARLRILRNQGMRARYEYVEPGHNYRLTDLQAAVGLPQLRRLAQSTERRRAHARFLSERLADVPGIVVPATVAGRTHVFHQFTIRVTPEAGTTRDELATHLHGLGVGSGVYYPRPVFDYECYRTHPRVVVEPMPRASRASAEVLSLPVHPLLEEAHLERIVAAVRSGCRSGVPRSPGPGK
jgi:dTDP-4-amino-4,6-dideoxygalactose transaminase